MKRQELIDRYLEAWNRKDVSELLELMDPQASYHDAFWDETCSGKDLTKYFSANFAADTGLYQQDDELIVTPGGVILRYVVFDRNNYKRRKPKYSGAEVITISNGLITAISDFYCDPDPLQLSEVATRVEKRRKRSSVAPLGLSARTSGRIKRQLTELAEKTAVFTDPSLTVTQLADSVGCSVVHLFHVLEEEKGTTFVQFVNELRINYAATLLATAPDGSIDVGQIASQSGFDTVEAFNTAFQSTFDMSAEEFAQRFDQRREDSIETAQ